MAGKKLDKMAEHLVEYSETLERMRGQLLTDDEVEMVHLMQTYLEDVEALIDTITNRDVYIRTLEAALKGKV